MESRISEHQELVKLGAKGQLTIPRSILRAINVDGPTPVVVETTEDGAILVRPAGVYPIERYTDARIAEFEETNAVPARLDRRVRKRISGR